MEGNEHVPKTTLGACFVEIDTFSKNSFSLVKDSWLLYYYCLLMAYACKYSVSLPRDAIGWSVVCDCGNNNNNNMS